MVIHPDSSELLKVIPQLLEGVSVAVLDDEGTASESYGNEPAHADEVRVLVPGGALVAAMPAKDPSHELVRSLLKIGRAHV